MDTLSEHGYTGLARITTRRVDTSAILDRQDDKIGEKGSVVFMKRVHTENTSTIMLLPQTLPELLLSRATEGQSTAQLAFLDPTGNVVKSQTYADLLRDASAYACRLVAAGLTREDVVLASFPDHENHIRLFWACCLAGIPVCPLPALHPDQSRQVMLFGHLQILFHGPTLIASTETIESVHAVAPKLKTIDSQQLLSGPEPEVKATDIFPGHQPLPRETVCFMLTSGSTSNSKAVLLRHSNLLSSVRGKIRHHGTTSASRFLNWIAFDHVACVTEVHLQALEANASQWHVSPAAVIRNPRNLLEWSSALHITYTFSPNFLLAQILRDVSAAPFSRKLDLSNLRALISGGEAVPILTAIAFADVLESFGGPRDALRAGFGMSETGAGCIYDTRPIPRQDTPGGMKYLSLGTCCEGVEMQVVNPETGKTCASGEPGQLQVRGPSVSTGYYGNARTTQESFAENGWFITGDSAQIDSDGNLFLMGRDKDSVNINGVKFPTQDMEHYIEDMKIEGVMPSYVYVSPMRLADADTETYGVFYQHEVAVEAGLDAAQTRAVNSANRAIKNACTVFCAQAPHIVLPLPRASFVKTALGKVSRAQLAKAYLRGEMGALQATFERSDDLLSEVAGVDSDLVTPVQQIVAIAIASIFTVDRSTLRRSQNVFDIGASSMHLLRLKQLIQERLSLAELPTIEMLKRPEIGKLCDYLSQLTMPDKQYEKRAPAEYKPLVCFNSTGKKPPVFIVHPGVGEVLVFVGLARVLADDRPVYALRAKGFEDGDTTFQTFDEMVDCYTSAIQECYPSEPYYVAGYSFGGAVAFEIGKRLEARGKTVAWIGVLNLPPHIQFRMKELTWVEVLLNIGMFLSLIPPSSLAILREQLSSQFPQIAAADTEPSNPQDPIDWLFARSDRTRLDELDLEIGAFTRWVKVAYELNRTGRTFVPQGFVKGALTTIFCAIPLPSMGTREEFKRDRLSAWKDFSGERFEMVDVEGEHYTMLSEAHVESFAAHMRGALSRADRAYRPDFDQVPLIDFSLSQDDPDQYLRQLRYALEDVGVCVFVNVPGFEDAFQTELFTLAEELFKKPQEWKDSLDTSKSPSLRGYFRADTAPEPHKAHAEAFRFGADLPAPGALDDPSIPFWLKLHEGPNQWPSVHDLPRFREKMEILFQRYHGLNLALNRHICQLLSVPYHVLDNYFPSKVEFNSAIWHYFPVTPQISKRAMEGFAQGMHEHRDPSTFVTCLIQSRAGLQVQNHCGSWIDIPMVPGGVVCNIGMQLTNLTGGKLIATTHRVNTLKIDADRFTIPYVLSTKLEKSVTPLPHLASTESAKAHVAPNPKISKLMAIEDPLIRSGYARLTLLPAATQKLYPKEFEEARRMGIV